MADASRSRQLGKLPARKGAVKLAFSQFFSAPALPRPPLAFGHYAHALPYAMYANDRYGDCVWAGAAHETAIWTSEVGPPAVFTDANVLADYAAVTGFNPADPSSDAGTDMQMAASYRRKVGIVDASGKRHTIDSYLALRPGDVAQLAQATYVLGCSAVGLRYPDSADEQFDAQRPWDVKRGAQVLGGHYVPCVGRNRTGNLLVVTWGRLHAMTPAFYETYCDEALAYVSLESLSAKGLSPEAFDAQGLRDALTLIANSTIVQPQGDAVMSDQAPTSASVPVQGVQIDPDEVQAVKAALQRLANEATGLGMYRHLMSDQLLTDVAQAAVAASVQYRSAPSI